VGLTTDGPLLGAALVSFAAGAVSFGSPCVLPLVPGYLAFVSGLSGAQAVAASTVPVSTVPASTVPVSTVPVSTVPASTVPVRIVPASTVPAAETRLRQPPVVLAGAVLFVLGFAVFFTLVGGAFGALGTQLAAHRTAVDRLGGAFVVALGLFMLGVVRPAFLEREGRPLRLVRTSGLGAAFPLGLVFGAGWTPCLGPTLASILTLSAAGPGADPARGALLAFIYTLGLGLPFVLVAAALQRGMRLVGVLRRHSRAIERFGGALLVVVGVALATGAWTELLAALRPFTVSTTTLL